MTEIENFTHNMRAIRLRKRWSQTELAEASGLHIQTITRTECGNHVPRFDVILMICHALGEDVGLMCSCRYEMPKVGTRSIGKWRTDYE